MKLFRYPLIWSCVIFLLAFLQCSKCMGMRFLGHYIRFITAFTPVREQRKGCSLIILTLGRNFNICILLAYFFSFRPSSHTIGLKVQCHQIKWQKLNLDVETYKKSYVLSFLIMLETSSAMKARRIFKKICKLRKKSCFRLLLYPLFRTFAFHIFLNFDSLCLKFGIFYFQRPSRAR